MYTAAGVSIEQPNRLAGSCLCLTVPTGHMNHPAVAVLHQVARLTVDTARRDAVRGEEIGVYGGGLAVAPRRWQVLQLEEGGK